MNRTFARVLIVPTLIAVILTSTAFGVRPILDSSTIDAPVRGDDEIRNRTDVASGLSTTTFDTLEGTVTVNLPDDIAAGDTISGTVAAEPKGKTGDEQAKNQDELSGYIVELAQQPTPSEKIAANLIDFCKDPMQKLNDHSTTVCKKWAIPEGMPTIELVLKNKGGKIVSRADVPVSSKGDAGKTKEPAAAPSISEDAPKFFTPALGQSGKPLSVTGPFDGDYANTSVKLGGQRAKFLASSPRKVIVQNPIDAKGANDIEVKFYGKTVANCTYRSISVKLAADKLNLTKGEQTVLTVNLAGLIGLLSPVSVQLSNKSPGIVSMQAGENQIIDVSPTDVNGDGFMAKRTLTGVKAGGFSITATIQSGGYGVCSPPNGGEPPILPKPQPSPPGDPNPPLPPMTPCRLYGEGGANESGVSDLSVCCSSDSTISSVQSRFCEGVSPDLPAPDSGMPGAGNRLGSETTIAFIPAWADTAGSHLARLVMGFNGSGLLNWAFSTDQGRTWTERNRGNGGPRHGPVENPALRFNSFRGDLSVIALKRPGGVAMVTLADTVSLPYPDLVVLLVSMDGGESFTKTSVFNDQVGMGITDQPRVTIDPADGTIWVMWRARTGGLAGAAPFFTYVRGGHVEENGSVTWNINGAGQQVRSNPISVDYQHPRFKVFHRPGATEHTIAVAGPQGAPGLSLFGIDRCIPGTSGAIRNSFWQYPLGVSFAVSEDNGQRWTDVNSADVLGQPFALGCVGGLGGRDAVGQLIYSENRIDLARDTRNGNYLVTRAKAVSDPANNAFIGQQVEIWRRSTVPGQRFTLAKRVPWNSDHPWQFNASIAANEDGQIAVSFYQTTGASQVVELMVIGSRDGGNTWSTPVQLSRNEPLIASDRSLGEYDEIVAVPIGVNPPRIRNPRSPFWEGAFYPSWSNGRGRVFAAGFSPPAP